MGTVVADAPLSVDTVVAGLQSEVDKNSGDFQLTLSALGVPVPANDSRAPQ